MLLKELLALNEANATGDPEIIFKVMKMVDKISKVNKYIHASRNGQVEFTADFDRDTSPPDIAALKAALKGVGKIKAKKDDFGQGFYSMNYTINVPFKLDDEDIKALKHFSHTEKEIKDNEDALAAYYVKNPDAWGSPKRREMEKD